MGKCLMGKSAVGRKSTYKYLKLVYIVGLMADADFEGRPLADEGHERRPSAMLPQKKF